MLKPEILFFMLLATVTLAMVLFGFLYWKLNRVNRELLDMRNEVNGDKTRRKTEQPSFDQNLALAELKARINNKRPEVAVPDKYRYITSLVAQGLDSGQISQVLQIGRGEAEQLVSLANLRRGMHSTQGSPA
ncbi:hypothetical protein [Geothermobacter hydrogeniphilus]|uniref:DUF2802 domain-containing protein n=1 Tax=Geothermobacter hydrogeniphilus TaxID=1969733 RepID=A0A1X0YEJ0_9BACT|nr:hypothetical protein [Geothermobacter hydrogeniphilus]ORJ63503.1 hypothetical protein B5V00_01155 [Geothermobacter hydrogeniphilus]